LFLRSSIRLFRVRPLPLRLYWQRPQPARAIQAARAAPGAIATLILPADTAWNQAERTKLRANLLLRFDFELHAELEIGMPGWKRFEMGGLPCINDDDPFRMLY